MRARVLTLALLGLAAPAARAADCSPTLLTPAGHEQLLAIVCEEALAGFPGCAEALFDSPIDLLTSSIEVEPGQRKTVATMASLLGNVLAGNNLANAVLQSLAGVSVPTVALNVDPCDGQLFNDDYSGGAPCSGVPGRTPHAAFAPLGPTLNQVLTDEQEALLGCGPFWGDDCEGSGIDPRRADTSALVQAWVGFDGRCAGADGSEDSQLANGEVQPGTIGFPHPPDAPIGQHPNLSLVGMRSPFQTDGVTPNPQYDVNRDGSIAGLVIPAEFGDSAGQPFANEMAAASFNLQLLLVVLSGASGDPEPDQFDPTDPYAAYDPEDPGSAGNQGRCSFLQPQHCRAVRAVVAPEPDASATLAAALATLAGVAARRRSRRVG